MRPEASFSAFLLLSVAPVIRSCRRLLIMHGCDDDDDAVAAQEKTSTKRLRWQEHSQLHDNMCTTKTY